MFELLANAWQATSTLEIVSVAFGLAYVILAARENSWCWPAALIGTGTAIFLFWDASLLMESALNVYYLVMAIVGWYMWNFAKTPTADAVKSLEIHCWNAKQHAAAIALVTTLTLLFGYGLSQKTNAALPYVDSFTTWSAVICTWMVARKVLENWLYWIVIDIVSVWLYFERELYLYALLFVLYSAIAVFGYLAWRGKMRYADQ